MYGFHRYLKHVIIIYWSIKIALESSWRIVDNYYMWITDVWFPPVLEACNNHLPVIIGKGWAGKEFLRIYTFLWSALWSANFIATRMDHTGNCDLIVVGIAESGDGDQEAWVIILVIFSLPISYWSLYHRFDHRIDHRNGKFYVNFLHLHSRCWIRLLTSQ